MLRRELLKTFLLAPLIKVFGNETQNVPVEKTKTGTFNFDKNKYKHTNMIRIPYAKVGTKLLVYAKNTRGAI